MYNRMKRPLDEVAKQKKENNKLYRIATDENPLTAKHRIPVLFYNKT